MRRNPKESCARATGRRGSEDPTEVDQKVGLSRNPIDRSTDKRRSPLSPSNERHAPGVIRLVLKSAVVWHNRERCGYGDLRFDEVRKRVAEATRFPRSGAPRDISSKNAQSDEEQQEREHTQDR
jgi:hypothetical protein